MQEDNPPPEAVRRELLERLKNLSDSEASGSLAELSYRRAREALEHALEEARTIRLQALHDARETRERELSAALEATRAMRDAAHARVEMALREAEVEVERLRSEAMRDAEHIKEQAAEDAARVRNEAQRERENAKAIYDAAEERRREIEQLEADFNATAARIAERLGITETPSRGWWRRD